jgi:hypothetical protein
MWNGLREYSPAAAYLVQSYSMNTNTINNMLAEIYNKNYTAYDIACNWVIENEQIWQNWIRPCKLAFYGPNDTNFLKIASFKRVGVEIQISMWVLTALCVAAAIFYMSVVVH